MTHDNVAPFTGVWIETVFQLWAMTVRNGRALHGRVD